MLPHVRIVVKTTISKDTAAQRAFLSARVASARTPPWALMHSPWASSRTIIKGYKQSLFQAKGAAQVMREQPILMAHPAERASVLDNNSTPNM